jgi:hypothetical protein
LSCARPAASRQLPRCASWVNTDLRADRPGAGLAAALADPAQAAEWQTSIQAITAYLPDLADAAGHSLTALHENGRLSPPTAPCPGVARCTRQYV